MGGCKCSFRDCNNSTERMPGMSFFHYPYKQPNRLGIWLSFCQKQSFHHLDIKGIRNKVVCSDHFKDEHFMNYQKNKLTKTAYPTLGRYRFNRVLVLDYEKNPNPCAEKLPKPTLPHLIPPPGYEIPMWSPYYQQSGLDCNSNDENESTEDEDVVLKHLASSLESNTPEKAMIDILDLQEIEYNPTDDGITLKPPTTPTKLKHKFVDEIEYHPPEIKSPRRTFKPQAIKEESSPRLKEPSPKKRKVTVKKMAKVLNHISTTTAKPEDIFRIPVSDILNSDDALLNFEDKAAVEFREIQTQTTPDKKSLPDHDKLLLKQKLDYESKIRELEQAVEKKSRDFAMLKKTSLEKDSELKAKISKLESQIKESTSNVNKPAVMSKAQLYNGLKKYLCPAMATLVRMEMFGGAEREWKKDEKIASIDILRLGDGVFNYFRDEWRLHLPAKKDVKEWAENADQFDDEEL
ncbi:hypothetical protein ACFFRR_011247 [Megaselia abdita]